MTDTTTQLVLLAFRVSVTTLPDALQGEPCVAGGAAGRCTVTAGHAVRLCDLPDLGPYPLCAPHAALYQPALTPLPAFISGEELHCPYCLTGGGIEEEDQGNRWNHLRVENGKVFASEGDYQFERRQVVCRYCCHEVTLTHQVEAYT
jgi:hypothetical protein